MSAERGKIHKKVLQRPYTRVIITSAIGNTIITKGRKRMKYECTICGYVYDEEAGDPDNGIEPGTAWEDLPDTFACPICGVEKADFEPVQ